MVFNLIDDSQPRNEFYPMTNTKAQIISVSRRTDIPAFYSEWFMQRIRAGYVDVQNPFNPNQISRISLLPRDVVALVFWTRNPMPLLPHLDELEQRGYRFYFHWTITGYDRPVEARTPDVERMIASMHQLAERLSPEHIIWRYDPIIFSNIMSMEWHVRNFERLAREISGASSRCFFSFLDFYRKTTRNLRALEPEVIVHEPPAIEKRSLAVALVDIATRHRIRLHACCESELLDLPGIGMSRCVDIGLIRELYPEVQESIPAGPTRPACGCSTSRDIGAYDSCLFRCSYCYANTRFDTLSIQRNERHDPNHPMLIPVAEAADVG